MITDRSSNNGATATQALKGAAEDASTKIGQLGSMAQEKVSDAVSYVRDRGFRGLQDDISDAAAKHPLGAVAVSLGVGYMLGKMLSRK